MIIMIMSIMTIIRHIWLMIWQSWQCHNWIMTTMIRKWHILMMTYSLDKNIHELMHAVGFYHDFVHGPRSNISMLVMFAILCLWTFKVNVNLFNACRTCCFTCILMLMLIISYQDTTLHVFLEKVLAQYATSVVGLFKFNSLRHGHVFFSRVVINI